MSQVRPCQKDLGGYPPVRRSSMLLATSSQTSAKSRSSCLPKTFSAFSASCREPVDQGSDRRIFLVLGHGGVIECAQEIAARVKLAQETLVVDIETERLGGGVEIGAVNEQGHFFRFGFHDCSRVRSSKLRYRLRTARVRRTTQADRRSGSVVQ